MDVRKLKQQVLAAFGKFVGNVGQAIYNDSASKPKKSNNKSSKEGDSLGKDGSGFRDTSESGGDPDAEIPKEAYQYIPYTDKSARRKNIMNLETVKGVHYTYKYDKNNEGGWAAYEGTEFIRNMDGADVASIEGLMSLYDDSLSVFNQEQVQGDLDKKQLAPKTPGAIGLGVIKFEGSTYGRKIEDIEKKMHEIFDETFKENFTVSDAGTERGDTSGIPGGYFQLIQNKIKITNKNTGEEKIYSIGADATQEVVDEINKDFADYIVDPLKP